MASAWSCSAVLESLVAITPCRRGEVIYARGDPAEHWYRVVSGAASQYAVTADGRRQVVDFLLPGEFFGFTARGRHAVAVEAVVEGTVVACYSRRRVEMLADSDPRVGRYIREMALQAVARAQARTLILGRATAPEKVGSFLVEMAERAFDGTADAVVLPLSRHDVAACLGLPVEAVGRAMRDLEHRDAITVAGMHRVRTGDRGPLGERDGGAR